MKHEATWTLEELGERVKDALATDYVAPGSARVRAVPDARTIRYYTTLGLVDRPVLHGRAATYGERHLHQLVAIKRLQADGLSLEQVQERLSGLPDPQLRELSRLAEGALAPRAAPKADAPRGRRDFWRTVPPEVAMAVEAVTERRDEASLDTRRGLAEEHGSDQDRPAVKQLVSIELGRGITLVLQECGRVPENHDVQALRRAAEALLCTLEERGLAPGRHDEHTNGGSPQASHTNDGSPQASHTKEQSP